MAQYSVIGDTLMFSEERPHRAYFLRIVRLYSFIVGICVTLIVAAEAGPFAPEWTAAWVAIYWIYSIGNRFLMRHPQAGERYRSQLVQILRAIFLLIGTTLFLGYLYLGTNYLQQHGGADTLWLLYVLSIFIVSQNGTTSMMVPMLALAAALLALIQIAPERIITLELMLEITAKCLWLVLLAFVLHVLLRIVTEHAASLRLLHRLYRDAIETASRADEIKLLNSVVSDIARSFGYPHVNIFYKQPDSSLKCIASANAISNATSDHPFTVPKGLGIIGHVVCSGERYLANNTDVDPYYFRSDAFPETKSEIALPIEFGGQTIGVLDIQDHDRNIFVERDEELLEIMSDYLSRIINNRRLRQSSEQINKIVESLAHEFLSQRGLKGLLDAIVRSALQVFIGKPDDGLVVLFRYDVLSDDLIVAAQAGTILQPQAFKPSADRTLNLVRRIIAGDEDYYFHYVDEVATDPFFMSSRVPGDHPRARFVEREKVVYRAIVRLCVGINRVGVLFMNFRAPPTFNAYEHEKLITFARLAALAIQQGQYQQQEVQFERRQLSWIYHDCLKNDATGLAYGIDQLLENPDWTDDRRRNKLFACQQVVTNLIKDLEYLHTTWNYVLSDDLHETVNQLVQMIYSIYGVPIDLHLQNDSEKIPAVIVTHTRAILSEGVMNAIRHGHASAVTVQIIVTPQQLHILIVDNGHGFNPLDAKPTGLMHMRGRAEQLGGTCEITSALEQGCRIAITIPLNHQQRSNNDEH